MLCRADRLATKPTARTRVPRIFTLFTNLRNFPALFVPFRHCSSCFALSAPAREVHKTVRSALDAFPRWRNFHTVRKYVSRKMRFAAKGTVSKYRECGYVYSCPLLPFPEVPCVILSASFRLSLWGEICTSLPDTWLSRFTRVEEGTGILLPGTLQSTLACAQNHH